MWAFFTVVSLLGLTTVFRVEKHGNWAWLLVAAPWVVPVGDALDAQVAYYLWTLTRQLRDGQSPIRMLTLLVYLTVLPAALGVQLFVMMLPMLLAATLGWNTELLIGVCLPFLPWFFWQHGWDGLGHPWWVGLAFWLRIALWPQPSVQPAQ